MKLEGEVALVTGGGQGMGRGIALRFAQEGADIVIFDLTSEHMAGVIQEIQALGRRAWPIAIDIADSQRIHATVKDVIDQWGHIDILVNNAGIGESKPFLEQTADDWRKIYDVNVFGLIHCCHAVLPTMVQRKHGNIINISSTAGKLGRPYSTHYGSSKAAVINLTQSLATEFAPQGIRVNAICPGFVLTDHWKERSLQIAQIRGMTPKEVIRQRTAVIPLGRPQTPEDVANIATFLVSKEAEAMTGQAINVTGGVELR